MKKKSKQHRILFAAVDIGWRIAQYKAFLENQFAEQVYIKSFVKHKVSKQQYQTKYDFEFQYVNYPKLIQWLISFSFFFYALVKFNTLYFFSGETILTRKLRRFEFRIYKLFNKKIIMHFVGSDVRNPNYLYWKSDNLKEFITGNISHPFSAEWQQKLITDCREFTQDILVSTPDLLQIVPEAKYFPVLINIDSFNCELKKAKEANKKPYFKTDKIKVLHAPSNAKVKGSEQIDQIMKKLLESNENFEYLNTISLDRETASVYSISRYELFQLYLEADIVIDQMIIGWYGLQSIEAILANCLVISFVENDLKKYLFKDCPIIQSNVLELEKVLKVSLILIQNNKIDFRKQIAWVRKYHTIENNHDKLIKSIQK